MNPTSERLYLRLERESLLAPGTPGPPGRLVEHPVLPELSEHVAYLEVYRETLSHALFEHVVPDAAIRVLFDITEGHRAWVLGPTSRVAHLRLEGTISTLTVVLRPGAAYGLLGMPARAVRDQCLPLDALWPRESTSLADRLQDAHDDREYSLLVQQALLDRIARGPGRVPARTSRAVALLTSGRRTVREAARALGVGERRLQQIFENEVGLTPRAYRRLARMRSCLQSLCGSRPPRWSELALAHGFYDQAHLANEFRELVGLSPTAFAALVAGSSKTALVSRG